MHIKNLTLGLGLVLAGTALGQQQQTYKVKNGDCDWTIARKFDTTVHKLHLVNPEVRNWDALRNGYALRIPGASAPKIVSRVETHPSAVSSHLTTRPFKVSGEDNDWIIAHHLGVSLHLLHQLNPDVDWNRLRPGKKITVPVDGESQGTVVAKKASGGRTKINRIRTRYAVVNTDGVSIRREAGQHAERVTTVDTGTRVVVLDRDGAWYKLRFPRGTEGWVRGDFLNATHAPASSHRRHQDDDSETVVARRRGHRGYRGDSGSESIAFLDNDAKTDPILKRAVAMRGTPYVFGSNSRDGTDCSGFTWQVYGSQGIHLPRTSGEQSQVGQPVTHNQLKRGDLVFFSSRGHRHGVGHVGIYMGNDKFIHASSGGGKVQINSLHDAYYQNHYKGARRVVKGSSRKSSESHSKMHSAHVEQVAMTADTNPTPLAK